MKKFALVVATWFGSGLIPPVLLKGMAGTYGSFFSLPLCALLMWWSSRIHEPIFGLAIGFFSAFMLFLLGQSVFLTNSKTNLA